MRLSGKTRIGVQALYDLAFHCRGQQTQAKEIAQRQQIPVRTLEEVLQELRKAGLVDAQRGPRGGYTLARVPEEISLSQIVRALDGPFEDLFTLRDVGVAGVPKLAWGAVVEQLAAVLGQATLGDFIARAEHSGARRQVTDHPQTMYVI